MTYKANELELWLHRRNEAISRRQGESSFRDLQNYKAWRDALEELGASYGVTVRFVPGHSVGYCTHLLRAGADPEHIKAIHILIYG